MAILITNLLVAGLAAAATLCALVLTLFIALMGRWVPMAVLLSYAFGIAAVWRWRSASRATTPLAGARRWATRALAISALGLAVAFAANLVSAIRPSQAELAGQFREQRSDYEAIRDMVLADELRHVSECGRSMSREPFREKTPEDLGIAPERRAAYERALRPVGCPVVVAGDGSVRFSLAAWGMANQGWRIGLHWSKTPPQPLVASIDDFVKRGGRSHSDTEYSRIDGDWYLTIVW